MLNQDGRDIGALFVQAGALPYDRSRPFVHGHYAGALAAGRAEDAASASSSAGVATLLAAQLPLQDLAARALG